MTRGQSDLFKGLVLSLVTTASGWAGGTIWTRYNAAEDQRRQTEANTADISALKTFAVSMEAKVTRIEASTATQKQDQDEFLQEIRGIVRAKKR